MRWINSKNAPTPFGNYSHATEHNGLVFISAQLPALPDGTHAIDAPADVQADLVLDNLEAVLAEAGSSIAQIMKLHVYITEIATRAAFEDAWSRRYKGMRPARTMMMVAGLNHGYAVSVDAIAVMV